jgi:hypothetical protein
MGHDVAVLMATCSFDRGQTLTDILAVLLRQIARQPQQWHDSYILSEPLRKTYRKYFRDEKQKSLKAEQLLECLKSEVTRFQSVYIIIDGLDELHKKDQRVELLNTLQQLEPGDGSMKMLVFSRDVPDISDWFNGRPSILQPMASRSLSQSLWRYIETRIINNKHLRRVIEHQNLNTTQLHEEVIRKVFESSAETYVPARTHHPFDIILRRTQILIGKVPHRQTHRR